MKYIKLEFLLGNNAIILKFLILKAIEKYKKRGVKKNVGGLELS